MAANSLICLKQNNAFTGIAIKSQACNLRLNLFEIFQ